MTRRFVLACLVPALLLGGCGGQDVVMSSMGPSKTMQICADSGGTLEARGKGQRPMCVHRFGDAGKSCASSRDCHGRCLADRVDGELPKPGAPAAGHCQPDDRLFGCHAEVDGGKAKAAICID